jgi:hypothetical protein
MHPFRPPPPPRHACIFRNVSFFVSLFEARIAYTATTVTVPQVSKCDDKSSNVDTDVKIRKYTSLRSPARVVSRFRSQEVEPRTQLYSNLACSGHRDIAHSPSRDVYIHKTWGLLCSNRQIVCKRRRFYALSSTCMITFTTHTHTHIYRNGDGDGKGVFDSVEN